jgi:hypothetical protein
MFSDDGHGWLMVTKAEVKRLGIAVSRYSHANGDSVFLEEDCDFPRFMATERAAGEPVEIVELYDGHDSPIRGYARFEVTP